MLVVLADDFSGASEIGGIAYRYGLRAIIQLSFNAVTDADVIVLDTDTRGMKEQQAIEVTRTIAKKLKSSNLPIQLFKKVDSVFRGHILPEINALQQELNFGKVLLLPANPVRGRKIISGNYFVNGVSLEKTVFATDPHFPTNSSAIKEIMKGRFSELPHQHIVPGDVLASSSLITADVTSKDDLKNYIKQTTDHDLCCGAAECFEAYLENKGFVARQNQTFRENKLQWPPYSLIISGSTVQNQFEEERINKMNIPQLSVPGGWENDLFVLEKERERFWRSEVLTLLQQHHVVSICIDKEVKQVDGAAEIFPGYFVKLVQYISEELGRENVHYSLTGGATASAIIRNIGSNNLKVKEEIAPGIVTLINSDTRDLFTVKPGSYLWPRSFIESLISK